MRIISNQPQMHFTRNKPIVVRPDTNIRGKRMSGYIYQQGDDYMILRDLRHVLYLTRMGFTVECTGLEWEDKA